MAYGRGCGNVRIGKRGACPNQRETNMANSSNTWGGNWVITLNVAENPKIKFGHNGAPLKSYVRFNLYRDGMTVAEYKTLVLGSAAGGKGYAAADLIWDTARGFITIAPPAGATAGAISAPPAARQPLPGIPATPINAALVAAALGVPLAPNVKVTVGKAKHAA